MGNAIDPSAEFDLKNLWKKLEEASGHFKDGWIYNEGDSDRAISRFERMRPDMTPEQKRLLDDIKRFHRELKDKVEKAKREKNFL